MADQAVGALAQELATLKRSVHSIQEGLNTGQLGNSSIDNGSIGMYDANGVLRGRIGAHGAAYGMSLVNNHQPPPVPNEPLVEGVLGGLRISTNGTSGNTELPVDFSHFNVYLAKAGDTGAVADKITADHAATVIAPLDYVEYRVWLTGENLSGTESVPSGEATATPQKAVGDDILAGTITELELAAGAVTAAKIAAGAVGLVQLGDKVVDVTKLADGSVTGQIIAANAIAAGNIAANAIQTNHIAAGAVQALNIAVGAIQADKIAAQAITADKIAALAITSDKIAANAITATKIDAGAITAEKIQAGIIISNATLQSGLAGRRVQISGPGNDIRFYPQVGETRYARIFSYIPADLPNDIAVELRAIDSTDADSISRMYLNPNRAFLGITQAADETLNGGGCVELTSDIAFFGMKTVDGTASGLGVFDDGGIVVDGQWVTGISGPRQGVACVIASYSAGALSATLAYAGYTMARPMAPIVSVMGGGDTGASAVVFWLRASTSTGFTTNWSDTGVHTLFGWIYSRDV